MPVVYIWRKLPWECWTFWYTVFVNLWLLGQINGKKLGLHSSLTVFFIVRFLFRKDEDRKSLTVLSVGNIGIAIDWSCWWPGYLNCFAQPLGSQTQIIWSQSHHCSTLWTQHIIYVWHQTNTSAILSSSRLLNCNIYNIYIIMNYILATWFRIDLPHDLDLTFQSHDRSNLTAWLGSHDDFLLVFNYTGLLTWRVKCTIS